MMVVFGGRTSDQSALNDCWGLRRHRYLLKTYKFNKNNNHILYIYLEMDLGTGVKLLIKNNPKQIPLFADIKYINLLILN